MERGDELPDWNNTTEHDIAGCSVQPMATEEVHFTGRQSSTGGVARYAFITRWIVYGPTEADVLPTDRVRWGGAVYDVEGQIQRWPSPTGDLNHVAFEIRDPDG